MMNFPTLFQTVVVVLHVAAAVAAPTSSNPTVTLDKGVFTGTTDGTTNKFLGIPFAKPPYVFRYLMSQVKSLLVLPELATYALVYQLQMIHIPARIRCRVLDLHVPSKKSIFHYRQALQRMLSTF